MNYLTIDGKPVNIFDVAQAHRQLESDYNVGGWLRECPSNLRRMESTSVQLHRMHYRGPNDVDITGSPIEGEDFEENVRYIYCANVLKWGLPMNAALAVTIERIFSPEVLTEYAGRIQAAKALAPAASEFEAEPQSPTP